MVFATREEAGRRLGAAVLSQFSGRAERDAPVVLALPRGGVPVAGEVARALSAPLDLVLVRKIGAPGQPELAAGAVVEGEPPVIVRNEDVIRHLRIPEAEIAAGAERGLAEIARRRALYLAGRAPVPVSGRDAVVVDDGIATGATMRAALTAVRARGPRSLTLAVPVAASDTLRALAGLVDESVCLSRPEPFFGVGEHYRDFHQLEDEEVIRVLAAAG